LNKNDKNIKESKSEVTEDYIVGKASIQDFLRENTSYFQTIIPKRRKDVIEKARQYMWSVGLLYRVIKLKIELGASGLEPVHADPKVEQFYKDIYDDLDMEGFVRSAIYEHELVGEWYPYFSWDDNTPINATLLDPTLVEVKAVFGNEFIYLHPSSDVEYIIDNEKNSKIYKKIQKLIPTKVLKKWKKGEPALLNSDNAKRYFNIKPPYEKYAKSPVLPIFRDLEILKMLKEADYVTAKRLRQLILQIKVGDPKLNDGSPVGKKTLKGAMDLWNDRKKSNEVFSQWFVSAEYITPDMDIFNEEKYKNPIKSIVDWSGLNALLSDGGSYSEGYIKVKGLRQTFKNIRRTIKKALNDFNKEIAIRNNMTYYGKPKTPEIRFSNSALIDDTEMRKTIEFLYKYGLLSAEDTLKNFGYMFDRQMNKKEEEQDFFDTIRIGFEPSQGLLTEEEKNSGKPKDPNNKQPRTKE